MVHSFQGSVQLRLVWEQVCSWYQTPGCCRKEVQGTCRRQVLLPGCCSFVGSSEVLYLLLPTLVAKSNIWCPVLTLPSLGYDNLTHSGCEFVQELQTCFLERADLYPETENKWQYGVVGLFGMNLRWPHWAVKPIKSLYYKIMCSEHAMYFTEKLFQECC